MKGWGIVLDPKLSLTEREAGGNTQECCILVGEGVCLSVYLNSINKHFLGIKVSPHILKRAT